MANPDADDHRLPIDQITHEPLGERLTKVGYIIADLLASIECRKTIEKAAQFAVDAAIARLEGIAKGVAWAEIALRAVGDRLLEQGHFATAMAVAPNTEQLAQPQ